MRNKQCPICNYSIQSEGTKASWILADILGGKKLPCLSCHERYPDCYEYALLLIGDRGFYDSQLLYWDLPTAKERTIKEILDGTTRQTEADSGESSQI